MLQWVVENRQWVFSGVGVAIILVLWQVISRVADHRRRQVAPVAISFHASPVARSETITPPPPVASAPRGETGAPPPLNTVLAQIKSAPLFHRHTVAASLVGLTVQCAGQLMIVRPIAGSGRVEVGILTDGGESVFFEVDLDKYPRLAVAEHGSRVSAIGKIGPRMIGTTLVDVVELTF